MKTSLTRKPTIVLVDDHLIFRQGLKSLITFENIGTVIGEASDGIEFMNLLTMPPPDLVIMDIDMPNMNGMEAVQRALELYPDMKIIVFSMFGDKEYYIKMIDLGVKGFILKSSGITELERAIKDVMSDKSYYSNELPKKTINKFGQKNGTTNGDEHKPNFHIPWW